MAGARVQFTEHLSRRLEASGPSSGQRKPVATVTRACNPATLEAGVGRSEVEGYLPHGKFKISLGYSTPCLKNQSNKQTQTNRQNRQKYLGWGAVVISIIFY